MHLQTAKPIERRHSEIEKGLPARLDCETLTLLRSFLTPILEAAPSWADLRQRLSDKGFDIAFRDGHLVLLSQSTGEAVCTGSALGVPLRQISERLGRPSIRAHRDGRSGAFT